MGEAANDRHESADPDSAGPDHEHRNSTQVELLRVAAQRRKHRDYIDAMLERARLQRDATRKDVEDRSDPGT